MPNLNLRFLRLKLSVYTVLQTLPVGLNSRSYSATIIGVFKATSSVNIWKNSWSIPLSIEVMLMSLLVVGI